MAALDVIVVNYRTPDDLQGFVDSYDRYSGTLDSNLWVVNVDPTEEDEKLGDHLEATALNPTRHLAHYENIGYARAVNNAVKRGTSPYIAIFNADTRITAGLLQKCVHALIAHSDWGVLGPRQLDERGRLTHAGIFGTQEAPKHRAWLQPDNDKYTGVEEAVTVSGSAYFVKRLVWTLLTMCPTYKEIAPDAQGAFLPTQFYYEETWCSYHAKAHGYKVMYYGDAVMTHKWHAAVKTHNKDSWAAQQMKESQRMFREACDRHGIPHD